MFGAYRTILALMVVGMHLGGIPRIGNYAVFGFYCLSGYLMTLIMQTNYGYTVSGISKYGLNRVLRIYPIYWFSILLSAVLIATVGEEFTSNYHDSLYWPKSIFQIGRNILLFFPFMESPRLTPPAWALTVEIFFYILIGFGISRTKIITIFWFLLSGLYHFTTVTFRLGWDTYFTVFAASLPFATGALIFHYREELTQYIKAATGALHLHLPLILLSLICINWFLDYSSDLPSWIFFYINFFLCAFIVATLLSRKELPLINRKLDKWLGDFSYPIYLMHFQVGLLVIILFSAFGIEIARPSLSLMFVSIPVILVVSWATTIILERPIEIVRSKVKRSQTRARDMNLPQNEMDARSGLQ